MSIENFQTLNRLKCAWNQNKMQVGDKKTIVIKGLIDY